MTSTATKEPECCPEFNPTPWEDKVIEWQDKRFVKARVCTLFYMPVNFGQVMKRLDVKIRTAGAAIPDYLCLSDHISKWNMDVYLAVDKEVPGLENITLSGKFFSKVYEGQFKDTGKWMKDAGKSAKTNGFDVKKWYMWYTTCPKCAKKYGKNYVVIVAQIG
jgi:hypothetical protein